MLCVLLSLAFIDLDSSAITIGHAMSMPTQHYTIPRSICCTVATKTSSNHIQIYAFRTATGPCLIQNSPMNIVTSALSQRAGMVIRKIRADQQTVWFEQIHEI